MTELVPLLDRIGAIHRLGDYISTDVDEHQVRVNMHVFFSAHAREPSIENALTIYSSIVELMKKGQNELAYRYADKYHKAGCEELLGIEKNISFLRGRD